MTADLRSITTQCLWLLSQIDQKNRLLNLTMQRVMEIRRDSCFIWELNLADYFFANLDMIEQRLIGIREKTAKILNHVDTIPPPNYLIEDKVEHLEYLFNIYYKEFVLEVRQIIAFIEICASVKSKI